MNKAKKIFAYVVSLVGLLLIGVALVYGFFYHTLFYQLGLPLLILVGGLLVFVTFKMIGFFIRYKDVEEEGCGILIFSKDEKTRILSGEKTKHLLASDAGYLKKGDLCEAKTEVIQKKPFAMLEITKVTRKPFSQLAKAEVLMLGSESEDALLKTMKKKDREFKVSNEINIIGFKVKE